MDNNINSQPRHLLVVDLEATCWDDRPQSAATMEIIEIGAVLVDLETQCILGEASTFVKPQINPELSDFCQQLTHITQSDVDQAPTLSEAAQYLNEVMAGWAPDSWGSWGAYDRRQFSIERERGRQVPDFFDLPHINLKSAYQESRGVKRKSGLGNSLKRHGMTFEGVQHRALSDARNIVRLLPYITHPVISCK